MRTAVLQLVCLAFLVACKAPGAPEVDSDPEVDTEHTGVDDPVGDGTELVALGYLGEATVDPGVSLSGTEALVAQSVEAGTERCRFEWSAVGAPHPQAAACEGCTFAFEVTLSGGHAVGPSCDWLFAEEGAPPIDPGNFSYGFHPAWPSGAGEAPALMYFYVDRWTPLTLDASFDAQSGSLSYRVDVGTDYF